MIIAGTVIRRLFYCYRRLNLPPRVRTCFRKATTFTRGVSISQFIALILMTGLSDLVVLVIGKLYGKLQEHAPLPTVILAVLIHRFFQKYEPKSLGICAFILFVMPAVVSGVFKQGTSSIFQPLIQTYTVFYTTLISSIVLYRLSPFHPLARYPGPALAKTSKLWFAYLGWKGKQHVHYRNLRKKYDGNIVRVGPNELMVSDLSVITALLGEDGSGNGFYLPTRSLNPLAASLEPVSDPAEHSQRRRTLTRGFNPAALEAYEKIANRRVVQLTEALTARKSVDLARMFGYFSHDVMNDIVFGGGSEMLCDGDLIGHRVSAETRAKVVTLLGHVPWLAEFLALVPAVVNALDEMKQLYFDRAVARKKEGTREKDLFHYLSDECNVEGEKIPFNTAASDAMLAVFAGSDATRTVLSSLFYYLLCNKEKLDKLREEINRFYPPGEPISSEHFQEMNYLDACLNETLRLSPPFPSGSPRDAGPNPDSSKGRTFGQYYFPEGTFVSIHPFIVQRDPRNFSQFTDEFWPERWLISQGIMEIPISIPQADFIHNPTAFISFSCGPADYVGRPLVMLLLRMTTVMILQNLDLRFEEGYAKTWEDDWRDQSVLMTGELPVVISDRK